MTREEVEQRSKPIPIVYYESERVPDAWAQTHKLSWQAYQTARNGLIDVCRRHGSTGPIGKCPIGPGNESPFPDKWEAGDKHPMYFVVDDQFNHERYLYVEIKRDGLTQGWINDVLRFLRNVLPGWGIALKNLRDGYLLIFRDRILVTGEEFRRCQNIDDVLTTARDLAV